MDPTTDILRARATVDDGLGRTYSISAAGHVLFVLLILIFPSGPATSDETAAMTNVISIGLGGPVGPSQGGETALAAQPVQEVLPLEEAEQEQWVQPPAPAPPEEIVPTPDAPRRPERDLPIESAPEEARGRTPTRGPELREGTALADTGARGAGVGLSAGGLGAGGALDLGDFCCPEYLNVMIERIRGRWNNRQEFTGVVTMKFTIQRDGRITGIAQTATSGYTALDLSAERALRLVGEVPPLPRRYSENALTVHLDFEYLR